MPKKRKRTLFVFALIIIVLYIVIGVVPSLTGALAGTELVEYGNLQLSDDTTCYIIRDETVYTASESGTMDPIIEEGTQIKKGTDLFAFTPSYEEPAPAEDAEASDGESEEGVAAEAAGSEYDRLIRTVTVNIAPDSGFVSQRKGVISYHVDGYEDYFDYDDLDKLSRENTEALDIEPMDIKRKTCVAGEPIYKISNNSVWYILFWVDQEAISRYENGKKMTVVLNGENIPATVKSIREADNGWQVVLETNRYYSGFAVDRVVEGTVINTDVSGLLVSNHCLTKRDGVVGVYVKNRTGDYEFTPVQVKISNGEQSVLAEGQFLDADGNIVETLEIYDEVLADPKSQEGK